MTDLKVSSVTKKGQFTIPKALREKYGIKDKIMIEEGERGNNKTSFTKRRIWLIKGHLKGKPQEKY